MDESTVKWSKDRYNEIKNALTPYIAQCGYDIEKDVRWVPISGLGGDNLKEPLAKNVCNWYDGPPLLDIIDEIELPKRDPNGQIRIPILDKMKDRGVVVFGKIE